MLCCNAKLCALLLPCRRDTPKTQQARMMRCHAGQRNTIDNAARRKVWSGRVCAGLLCYLCYVMLCYVTLCSGAGQCSAAHVGVALWRGFVALWLCVVVSLCVFCVCCVCLVCLVCLVCVCVVCVVCVLCVLCVCCVCVVCVVFVVCVLCVCCVCVCCVCCVCFVCVFVCLCVSLCVFVCLCVCCVRLCMCLCMWHMCICMCRCAFVPYIQIRIMRPEECIQCFMIYDMPCVINRMVCNRDIVCCCILGVEGNCLVHISHIKSSTLSCRCIGHSIEALRPLRRVRQGEVLLSPVCVYLLAEVYTKRHDSKRVVEHDNSCLL